MRTDGHDLPRFAMPAVDHDAGGPLSLLVRALTWLVLAWRQRNRTPMFSAR
jgi:hypothetical protein